MSSQIKRLGYGIHDITLGDNNLDNSSTTPLAANTTFTGASYIDLLHVTSIVINVQTDVDGTLFINNSQNGVDIDRTSSFPVTGGTNFVIGATPLTRYIRIQYTNGATIQTTFHLQTIVRQGAVSPTLLPLNATLADASIAQNTRTIVGGKNPSGVYGNIERSTTGGFRTSIDPLNTDWQVQQTAVTGTAAQFGSTALTGRKTITFLAPTANTKIIAIGKTSAITITTGSFTLGPGASLTLELDAAISTFWAIAESGTQRLCWVEIA